LGPVRLTDKKKNQVEMYGIKSKENQVNWIKSTVLGTLPLCNSKDPDPDKAVRSGSVSN
jgi:hypothetical protein